MPVFQAYILPIYAAECRFSRRRASGAEAVRWGKRGEGYRRMIDISPAERGGTPVEVGTVGALPIGEDGAFITGSDFLLDGGVTAATGTANMLRNNLSAG